jgi:hypothetical protein
MITKPLSQFFIYDKATCKSRPCGQHLPAPSGASSHLSEITHIFHPLCEVRARHRVGQTSQFSHFLQVLFLTPNVHIQGAQVDALLQDHFLCPLFRTPSCGIDVHKHLPHVFNAESAPIWDPSRDFIDETKQRTQPLLYALFSSTDSCRLQSSMAAAVMFQSKEPQKQMQ